MLRVNNESIVQLKQLTPNHKVPFGLLSEGKAAIDAALVNFEGAKKADKINEALPTAEQIARATLSPRRQRSNSSGGHHIRTDSLRVLDETLMGELTAVAMGKPPSPKNKPPSPRADAMDTHSNAHCATAEATAASPPPQATTEPPATSSASTAGSAMEADSKN